MKNTIIAIISALIISPLMAQCPNGGSAPQCPQCPNGDCGKKCHKKGMKDKKKPGMKGHRHIKRQNGEMPNAETDFSINVLCVSEVKPEVKPEVTKRPARKTAKRFVFGPKRPQAKSHHGQRHMAFGKRPARRHQMGKFQRPVMGSVRPQVKPVFGKKSQHPTRHQMVKAHRAMRPQMKTQRNQRHMSFGKRHMSFGKKLQFQRPVMGKFAKRPQMKVRKPGFRIAAHSVNPAQRQNPHGAWKRVPAKKFTFGPKRQKHTSEFQLRGMHHFGRKAAH